MRPAVLLAFAALAAPALSADLFGDWREAVVCRAAGDSELRGGEK